MNPSKHNFSKIEEQIRYNIPKLGIVNDYKKQIPKPSSLGVSSGIWVTDLVKDVDAVKTYVDYLTKGPAIGNRYQFQGGWCKDGKTPRMVTVDNIPSGAVHLPGIPAYTLGRSNLRGLIPGLFEDIWQISPGNLLNYMKGKGQIYQECFENRSTDRTYIYYTILFIFLFSLCIYYNRFIKK